jgi:hypothetical protein
MNAYSDDRAFNLFLKDTIQDAANASEKELVIFNGVSSIMEFVNTALIKELVRS